MKWEFCLTLFSGHVQLYIDLIKHSWHELSNAKYQYAIANFYLEVNPNSTKLSLIFNCSLPKVWVDSLDKKQPPVAPFTNIV